MVAKRRFCAKENHDTWVEGRYPINGGCRVCSRAGARRRYREGYRPYRSAVYTAKVLARAKDLSAERPEHRAAINRKYHASPKGQVTQTAYRRKWQQENRVHANQLTAARRLKTPPLSKNIIDALLGYYGSDCVYCGGEASGFDHLQPLSKGGEHVAENLAPCCQPCNSTKNNKPIWTLVA